MSKKSKSSTSAKILFSPVSILSGVVSSVLAGIVFKRVGKMLSSGKSDDKPEALNSEFRLRDVLIAAAAQGVLYAVIKALIDRGGARAFERATGEWPGN